MKKNNRVVVLLSGNGSNLQALLNQQSSYSYRITGVISNRPDAFGLQRAKQASIPAFAIDHTTYASREKYDQCLIQHIDSFEPDLVVLAGYMRILSAAFVSHYQHRLINIHPSLLPDYKGLHTHRRVLEDQRPQHGATVHCVTDKLDDGRIIIQASLAVMPHDNEESLRCRVQKMEHGIYPMAVDFFTSGRLKVNNEQLNLDNTPLGQKGYQLYEQQLIDML
ncbi:MAG: phosphoribosylglycinamide formyltransferase [Endozoicomonas sp. (ex Botrylloides leachii)]|nr:phosphoribosylglycinamide formyltransferase [Endozoicomonas sp. (ex Botrylloides leachii)]